MFLVLVAFVPLTLIALLFSGDRQIQSMPVRVMTPTNPPPQLANLGGTWIVGIPYELSTNKPVTTQDVQEIRYLIPRLKTIGLLYAPDSIDVDLSGDVSARFTRANRWLHVDMKKAGDKWEIRYISPGRPFCSTANPSLGDRINELLPF